MGSQIWEVSGVVPLGEEIGCRRGIVAQPSATERRGRLPASSPLLVVGGQSTSQPASQLAS